MTNSKNDSSGSGEDKQQVDAFSMNAIRGMFEAMDRRFMEMGDRMERMERRNQNRAQPPPMQGLRHGRRNERQPEFEDDPNVEEDDNENVLNYGRQENRRYNQNPIVDRNISSIKMKISPFKGRNDPDAYLEWERKMELIFECHNYSEEKKVKLACVEFTDYAVVWWDQLCKERRRNGERPVQTWVEMKHIMKKCFVPNYYYRELHNRLQRLTQGSMSVEEYQKEMEMAMIRANVEDDPEATMARFLSGLNRNIADQVELQHYVEFEDMVNMAMKIEKQLKRKGSARYDSKPYSKEGSSTWKSSWGKKDDKTILKLKRGLVKLVRTRVKVKNQLYMEGISNVLSVWDMGT